MKEPEERELRTVDRFIDDRSQDNHARWCLLLMRFPSSYLADFEQQLSASKLYCTYNGKRWQVMHASPHGYIKLQTLSSRETTAVSPFECTEWDSIPQLRLPIMTDAYAAVEEAADALEGRSRVLGILRSVSATASARFLAHAAYLLRKLATDVSDGKTPWLKKE